MQKKSIAGTIEVLIRLAKKPEAHRGLIAIFDTEPSIWASIQSIIDPKDLHPKVRPREPRPHCTIANRIYDEVDFSDILEALKVSPGLSPYSCSPRRIDVLENVAGDVAYLELNGDFFRQAHSSVSQWDTSTRKYEPHITIACVLPGRGSEYCGSLSGFGVQAPKFIGNRLKYILNRRVDAYYDLISEEITIDTHKSD